MNILLLGGVFHNEPTKRHYKRCQGFGYAENAAAWSAAYVRYVRSDNSCTDSGKQLFSEYLTGIVRTGDIVLCRIRYLVFHLCTKFKVPAFLGSSFAFLGGFSSVAALDTGIFANMADKEKLQYACGGIVVAGLLYLILALIIRCVGVKRVMRFLPPVVTGPIIICIGLSLAPSAVSNASTNWLIAIVALAVIIISISGEKECSRLFRFFSV